jgi:hypothetical protein
MCQARSCRLQQIDTKFYHASDIIRTSLVWRQVRWRVPIRRGLKPHHRLCDLFLQCFVSLHAVHATDKMFFSLSDRTLDVGLSYVH